MQDKPPMYQVRPNGKADFTPAPWARRFGIKAKRLGYDSDDARSEGWRLYRAAVAMKQAGSLEVLVYARGSLGRFFEEFKRRAMFQKKALRTRRTYEDAWLRIGPRFGTVQLSMISVDDCEDWVINVEADHGPHVRYRAAAKLSELLRHAVARNMIPTNPMQVVPNPMPPGRSQTWTPGEIERLIGHAFMTGERRLSLLIRVLYETGMAPVDARTLTRDMIRDDQQGAWIERSRTKTGKGGCFPLSASLARDLRRIDDAAGSVSPALGSPWTSDAALARAFAKLRAQVFGEDEKRQLRDIRRTFNVEMELGNASPSERAALMANALDRSPRLDATYTPPSVERARQVLSKRAEGQALRRSLPIL